MSRADRNPPQVVSQRWKESLRRTKFLDKCPVGHTRLARLGLRGALGLRQGEQLEPARRLMKIDKAAL